jgi:hypothetical protein
LHTFFYIIHLIFFQHFVISKNKVSKTMAPICMSSARKRRPAKGKGTPEYDPSAAHELPFGAPPTKKASPTGAEASAAFEKADETSTKKRKRQKTTTDAADVTAYESPKKSRKVNKMSGMIDDLSVKPSKTTKLSIVSKVPKQSHEQSRKREAATPVYTNRISAKRPRTSSWTVEDDSIMDDTPSDTATAAATKPQSSDESATPASAVKLKYPISLEKLAKAEIAAQAAREKAASSAEADLPSPATPSGKCFAALSFKPN